jgi:hypothetical protein
MLAANVSQKMFLAMTQSSQFPHFVFKTAKREYISLLGF